MMTRAAMPRQTESVSALQRLLIACGLAVLFVFLAVVMTYQDIPFVSTRIPGDYADGHFVQWNLYWNIHAFPDGLDSVFNANMYWPHRNTLAYADPLLAPALVTWLGTELFGYPSGYVVTYLFAWVLSLWGSYLLAMWFTGNRQASVVGAIIYSFAAPRLSHLFHFQLVFAGALIPFALLTLLRLLDSQRWPASIGFGLAAAAIALTSGYYALFTLVGAAAIFITWLVANRGRMQPVLIFQLAAAALIAGLLAYPVARIYSDVHDEEFFQRNPVDDKDADLKDFVSPAGDSILYQQLDVAAGRAGRGIENRSFPGIVAVVLAAGGFVAFVRAPRRALAALLIASGLCVVFAFGRKVNVAGWLIPSPYSALADHVPGFSSLRSPSRFLIITLVGVATLAAVGASQIFPRHRLARIITLALVSALALAEYAVIVYKEPAIDNPDSLAVNQELAELPPGAVVELPMADPSQFSWGFIEAPRMFLSRYDWNPRVNGYSGFYPPGYVETVRQLNSIANERTDPQALEEALGYLSSLNVRYVVTRTAPVAHFEPGDPDFALAAYDEGAIARLGVALSSRLARIERLGDAVLFVLRTP